MRVTLNWDAAGMYGADPMAAVLARDAHSVEQRTRYVNDYSATGSGSSLSGRDVIVTIEVRDGKGPVTVEIVAPESKGGFLQCVLEEMFGAMLKSGTAGIVTHAPEVPDWVWEICVGATDDNDSPLNMEWRWVPASALTVGDVSDEWLLTLRPEVPA